MTRWLAQCTPETAQLPTATAKQALLLRGYCRRPITGERAHRRFASDVASAVLGGESLKQGSPGPPRQLYQAKLLIENLTRLKVIEGHIYRLV